MTLFNQDKISFIFLGVEYSLSMLEPVRPGAVSPDRALCLATFNHFVMVNKTSLSISLS
jgi:hypothetical protein